jgi:hypothetical protein
MTTTQTVDTFINPDAIKAKIATGSITLAEVTRAIAKPESPALPVAVAPLPSKITVGQQKALTHLEEVYGVVQPEEVRALTDAEVVELMEERLTLDEVEKVATARKESIKTAVLNHIDTVVGDGPRNKEGHVLTPTKVESVDHQKAFSWEVSNRGGSIDAASLKALEESGDLSHDDYLALTDQVRVVNESKVMLALQKNPKLLDVLAKAVTGTSQVGSLYVRKA